MSSEDVDESVELDSESVDIENESDEHKTAEEVPIGDRLGRMKLAPMFAGFTMIGAGSVFIFTDMYNVGAGLVVVSMLLFVAFMLKFMFLKMNDASGGMLLE